MENERKALWIRFGGSNRKMAQHLKILTESFPEFFHVGTAGLGMHHSNRCGTINDTPENRTKIKSLKGITIQRKSL